jgi:hypothetical protein
MGTREDLGLLLPAMDIGQSCPDPSQRNCTLGWVIVGINRAHKGGTTGRKGAFRIPFVRYSECHCLDPRMEKRTVCWNEILLAQSRYGVPAEEEGEGREGTENVEDKRRLPSKGARACSDWRHPGPTALLANPVFPAPCCARPINHCRQAPETARCGELRYHAQYQFQPASFRVSEWLT